MSETALSIIDTLDSDDSRPARTVGTTAEHLATFTGYPKYRPAEILIQLPPDHTPQPSTLYSLLTNLTHHHSQLAWEFIATAEAIHMQLVCPRPLLHLAADQIHGHIPEVLMINRPGFLLDSCRRHDPLHVEINDLQSSRENYEPFPQPAVDVYIGLVAAMGGLQRREIGICQILFRRLDHAVISAMKEAMPHPATLDHVVGIVEDRQWYRENGTLLDMKYGGPSAHQLQEKAELLDRIALVNAKLKHPLLTIAIRIAAGSTHRRRAQEIFHGMNSALAAFDLCISDRTVTPRQLISRKAGASTALVNLQELLSLVHTPSPQVITPRFVRIQPTRKPPKDLTVP